MALLLTANPQLAGAEEKKAKPAAQKAAAPKSATGKPKTMVGESAGGKRGTVGGSLSTGTAGPSFGLALASEYREYVRQESEKYYDRFPARKFLDKATAASTSDNVMPEVPGTLGAKGADKVALDEGRTRLLTVLGKNARTRVPALAAKTQARYDCWAIRAAKQFESDDIQQCRDDFNNMIVLLEEAVMPVNIANPFLRRLFREYLAYSKFEEVDQRDWIDARFFSRKALRSAEAKNPDQVLPESISRWNLQSRTDVPTYMRYRTRLIRAYDAGARTTYPVQSAVAQARFDCWVERTSERADKAFIEKCRREFLAMLAIIEKPKAPKVRQWIVYFGFDKSNIRRTERPKINEAAGVAKQARAQVTVVGHTDTKGSPAYNVGLSLRRADAVREALILAGVAASQIRVFARGETDPAVKTGDNVRSQANRRATINVR